MPESQFERASSIFLAAVALPPDSRIAYIDEACQGDDSLRSEVQSLLASDATHATFLDTPALNIGSGDMGGLLTRPVEPGTRMGQYTINALLGIGGMGIVYSAEQDSPRRTVALKMIRPELATPSLLRRFEHEAQVLARLQHPGIAQIFEAGWLPQDHGGLPYFAMELITGEPLSSHLEHRRLSTDDRLRLFIRVCEAVQHAHQNGVIHRDLKPDNILIDGSGPRILDFGIARLAETDVQAMTMQTSAGQIVGTFQYMSPEQLSPDVHVVDSRADIYSLGVILFRMLTGRLPYDVKDVPVPEAIRRLSEIEPLRLDSVDRSLRGDLATIVSKAMERDRERRYPSAAALADDIRRYLQSEPIAARPTSTLYQLRKLARRNKALVAGLAAVGLALLLGFVGIAWQWLEAEAARDVAAQQATAAQEQFEEAEAMRVFLERILTNAAPGPLGSDVRVVTVLDDAARSIDESFEGSATVEAGLRRVIGQTYEQIGVLGKAEEQIVASLAIYERELGPLAFKTIAARGDYAGVLRARSEFGAAEPILREVLGWFETNLEPEGSRVQAHALNNLGVTLWHLGQFEEAEEALRRSMQLHEGYIRDNPIDEIYAGTLDTLARVLQPMGRLDEAEALHIRALEILETLHGKNHPLIALNYNHRGQIKFMQGDVPEAGRLVEEALRINRVVMPAMHPEIAATTSNLAIVTRTLGDYERAEELFIEALAMRRELLDGDHMDVGTSINELARLYMEMDEYSKAIPLFREAVAIYRNANGDDSIHTAIVIANLGRALAEVGEYEEAEEHLVQALAVQRKALPVGARRVPITLLGLARVAGASGRVDEQTAYLREAVEIARGALAPAHDLRALCELRLGLHLTSRGLYDEAEAFLLAALESRRTAFGLRDERTRAVIEALIDLYDVSDQPEKQTALDADSVEPGEERGAEGTEALGHEGGSGRHGGTEGG